MIQARNPPPPSWAEAEDDNLLPTFVDWEALRTIAVAEKQRTYDTENAHIVCEFSKACSQGRLHIIRRLEFSDGDIWIVRIQKTSPSAASDWEGAIVGPWELVEFIKDLCIVPAAMNGPLHRETLSAQETRNTQKVYIENVREAEQNRSFDDTMSMMLGNSIVQDFAHAFWLWGDGKAGLYTDIEIFQCY